MTQCQAEKATRRHLAIRGADEFVVKAVTAQRGDGRPARPFTLTQSTGLLSRGSQVRVLPGAPNWQVHSGHMGDTFGLNGFAIEPAGLIVEVGERGGLELIDFGNRADERFLHGEPGGASVPPSLKADASRAYRPGSYSA